MSHDRDARVGRSELREQRTPTGKVGLDVDLALIALTMVVTVPRVGWWMARWEQPDLRFVGYAAAVVFDLAILRLAYVWKRAAGRRQRAITGMGFLFFAVGSGLFQAFYLVSQGATVIEAAPLAAIWPMALGILALHKAAEDEHRVRRRVRSSIRRSGDSASGPVRTDAPLAARSAGRPDALRNEAERLSTAGRSIRQIAGELGVPRSTVGDWVRGRATSGGR